MNFHIGDRVYVKSVGTIGEVNFINRKVVKHAQNGIVEEVLVGHSYDVIGIDSEIPGSDLELVEGGRVREQVEKWEASRDL